MSGKFWFRPNKNHASDWPITKKNQNLNFTRTRIPAPRALRNTLDFGRNWNASHIFFLVNFVWGISSKIAKSQSFDLDWLAKSHDWDLECQNSRFSHTKLIKKKMVDAFQFRPKSRVFRKAQYLAGLGFFHDLMIGGTTSVAAPQSMCVVMTLVLILRLWTRLRILEDESRILGLVGDVIV